MRRTAVIDLGSNSFRLVVYDWEPGGPWTLSDEIREPVRVGAGMGEERLLQPDAIERAVGTAAVFASFCRAAGIEDVVTAATSAIRDAENRDELLERIGRETGLAVRVLDGSEEAHYGYLAAANSTTVRDGFALDMGGGSIQLSRLEDRLLRESESLPLGAVRVSERFLAGEQASPEDMCELRDHVRERVGALGWWLGGGRLVGIGGSIRNLAAAAQKAGDYPDSTVQGFALTRTALAELIEELASLPASKRGRVAGIKPDRADVILGAALVLAETMDAAAVEQLEVSEAGLREGLFFERFLADESPPLLRDVRRQSVENLARRYGADVRHTEHVTSLSLALYDSLADLGLADAFRDDRELLAAACALHDIGVAVDYDDHHKHSRYLIRAAGLPGFSQREAELVALVARYHRKGEPDASSMGQLARADDADRLRLLAAVIRLCEQLERSRDQSVRSVSARRENDGVAVEVEAADAAVAIWSARRAAALLERALGARVEVRQTP